MHPLQPGSIVQLTSLGQLPARPLHRLRRPTARPRPQPAPWPSSSGPTTSPPGLAPPLPGPRHRPSLASTFRHPPNCYRYRQSVLLPIFSGPSFFPCRDRLRLHPDPSHLVSRYLARNQDQEHKGHIVLSRRRHQLRPPLARPSPPVDFVTALSRPRPAPWQLEAELPLAARLASTTSPAHLRCLLLRLPGPAGSRPSRASAAPQSGVPLPPFLSVPRRPSRVCAAPQGLRRLYVPHATPPATTLHAA